VSHSSTENDSTLTARPFAIVCAIVTIVCTTSDITGSLLQAIATIGNGPADGLSLQSAARNIYSGIRRTNKIF